MASQGRRRLEVGWFETAVLMGGYLASLAVVYLLGIYVGKGVQERRLGSEGRLIRLPVPDGGAPAGGGLTGQEPELTFYDALAKAEPAPTPPSGEGRIIVSGEPARPSEAGSPTPPPTAAGDRPLGSAPPLRAAGSSPAPAGTGRPPGVSPEALATVRPPGPPVRPGGGAATIQPPPAPPSGTSPEALGTVRAPGPPPRVSPEAAATARALAPPPGVTPEAVATVRPAALPPPSAPPRAGSWSVQVDATKEAAVADSLVKRLRERGYDAFVVKQARGSETWYRVRVGHLPTLDQANALVSRLKEREGLPRAFVASE